MKKEIIEINDYAKGKRAEALNNSVIADAE